MNTVHKRLALMCVGLVTSLAHGSCDSGPNISSPYIAIRSQGRDKVIQMVGMVGHTHNYCDPFHATLAITPEFTKSFNPDDITQCLFGPDVVAQGGSNCDDNARCIRIQGSSVANRDANAWLADYFYLPVDFDSTICFEPRIKTFLLNLDKYVNLDCCVEGMYFRLYGPIVWTKWDLNFCETVLQTGTNGYIAGYFAPISFARTSLLQDFSAYACGTIPATDLSLTNASNIIFNGLQYARMDCGAHTAAGFAELRAEFGWDFWHDACNHLGVNVQAAAPTGKRPKACFVFEPMIGNGHHWELGAGFTGHHLFYTCAEQDRCLGFYYDVNITHLFSTRQRRTFDLCDKPNSRYMLAERLGKPVANGLAGTNVVPVPLNIIDQTLPNFQFKNEFTPVANLTTFDVHVSAALQADIVAMFNFCHCNWSIDVGYNFWMRSAEHISANFDGDLCEFPTLNDSRTLNTWALKGDAHVFGFDAASGLLPIALSATESNATIHQGTNALPLNQTAVLAKILNQNTGIDNPAVATVVGTENFLVSGGGLTIKTSIDPILLNINDVDLHGTKGLSHKVFAHMSYTWWDRECWTPFIGFGGFGEFGKQERDKNSNTGKNCAACVDCNESPTCSLSQWGLWVKGGVSY